MEDNLSLRLASARHASTFISNRLKIECREKKLLEKSIHGRKKGWERESDSWKIIHHLQRYQNSASDNSKLLFWHFSRVQPSWYRQNSRNIDADILLASLKRHRSIQNKNFSLPTRKKILRCKKKDKYFLADEPEKQHRMARMPAAPPCWMHQAEVQQHWGKGSTWKRDLLRNYGDSLRISPWLLILGFCKAVQRIQN